MVIGLSQVFYFISDSLSTEVPKKGGEEEEEEGGGRGARCLSVCVL